MCGNLGRNITLKQPYQRKTPTFIFLSLEKAKFSFLTRDQPESVRKAVISSISFLSASMSTSLMLNAPFLCLMSFWKAVRHNV
jgi:hypothetical protein